MPKKIDVRQVNSRVPGDLSDRMDAVSDIFGNKARVLMAAILGFLELSEDEQWRLYREVQKRYFS